jgi:hypothetical protein
LDCGSIEAINIQANKIGVQVFKTPYGQNFSQNCSVTSATKFLISNKFGRVCCDVRPSYRLMEKIVKAEFRLAGLKLDHKTTRKLHSIAIKEVVFMKVSRQLQMYNRYVF